MLGFLRPNCVHLTDVNSRRTLCIYRLFELSYGSELWAPQTTSKDLLRIVRVQRRATKFILQDHMLTYVERLKRLNLIPISYWFEIKDITFFFKCKVGYFDLKLEDYVVQPPHHLTRVSSANTLRPNLCRTSFFRNFYFNRVVLMWNNLPSTIKSYLTFLRSKVNYY
jgi:hypothetical protein